MLATGLAMLAGARRSPVRATATLFCFAAASFALHSQGPETEALGVLRPLVWLLSAGGTGYFWLFAVTLFEDRPLGWDRALPPAALTLLAAVALVAPREIARGVWVTHNLAEIALVAHVLWVVGRGRGGDLVEARRTLRAPFVAVLAVYAALLSGLEIAGYLGLGPQWGRLVEATSLAGIAFAGAVVFLQSRPELFDAPRRSVSRTREADHAEPTALSPEHRIAPRDRMAFETLRALMASDEIWRREGLTIGELASEIGTPEHRLRRLINDALGYRNFSAFLNARRIEAATAALASPARAGESVSEIAFALGYTSLGPFNRAFKEVTGETPTGFRARALGVRTRIPEKAP
jgi:AraC-like DNA-binding protein